MLVWLAGTVAMFAASVVPAAPAHAHSGPPPVITRQRLAHQGRIVALSFDDGPDPRYTPTVLADLARYHDHATFFEEGQFVRRWPALSHQVVAGGDELGNHTYDHPDLRRRSRRQTADEVRRANAAFAAAGLPAPELFRPPKGYLNTTAEEGVRDVGLPIVKWTPGLCVEHWTHGRAGAARAMRLLADHVRPGDILLAHDGGIPNRARTMAALPYLLAALQRRGYEVVTVSTLLADSRPAVSSHG
jgi:peptidoglycan/xylan/chitin deacetylase (PgdA/CDA1 family)